MFSRVAVRFFQNAGPTLTRAELSTVRTLPELATKDVPTAVEDVKLVAQKINWQHSNDSFHPYEATVDGNELKLRINSDYPETDLYTVLKNGKEIEEINNFPATWTRPNI
jgi:hypothetical protein